MSNVSEQVTRPKIRRQRSIYQVHYGIKRSDDEMTAKPVAMPTSSLELQAYDLQVAGHKKTEDTKYLGLLQCNNGTILKPILKEAQKREVDFYTILSSSSDPELVELRKCTPKYFGCRKFTYNGHEQDYIILEDLSQRMLEPCIMDVKIGKRTWDPLATEEKIKNEQSKYALCKQQYGFCIPGFQVYKLTTGKLQKYNKDYGKRLHGQAVRDAIRNYLNGSGVGAGAGAGLCRALVLQLLSELWRIQKWARRQTSLRLYSSSLLLVYDAAKLRDCCGDNDLLLSRARCRAAGVPRRRSIHSLNSDPPGGSGGGPAGGRAGPGPPAPPAASPWTAALDKLHHNHSFEHNYEDKLCKMKMSYRALLERLSSDAPAAARWATVRLIDCAHAFFNQDDDRAADDNFRDGVDSFVQIFECFLRETDDQIV